MKPRAVRSAARAAERGASLIFSLLALVALSLAAVAVVRSVDTGALVIGNVGFKLDATTGSDRATEMAIGWLTTRLAGNDLEADAAQAGYYASSLDNLDPGGHSAATTRAVVDWNDDGQCLGQGKFTSCITASPVTTTTGTGNRSRYVITRLCVTTGSPTAVGNSCALPIGAAGGADKNRNAQKTGGLRADAIPTASPYYRIVVRTVGARDTVSITETIVHF